MLVNTLSPSVVPHCLNAIGLHQSTASFVLFVCCVLPKFLVTCDKHSCITPIQLVLTLAMCRYVARFDGYKYGICTQWHNIWAQETFLFVVRVVAIDR